MSKSKNKNGSELEHLRGLVRRLKAELKQYKKYSPRETVREIKEDDFDCPQCGKGYIHVLDLLHVQFYKCDTCGYKEKVVNGKKKD